MTEIDYTKMRLGKVTHIYNGHKTKISICEKCGRKGEPSELPLSKSGKRVLSWTHKGKIVSVAGFSFLEVSQYCSVVKEAVSPEASLQEVRK